MSLHAEALPLRRTKASSQWAAPNAAAAAIALAIIYSLIVPLVLLDLWTVVYQKICFPLLGIKPVTRREYLVLDRHRLPYLNALEKANCAYCGYANGVVAFVREVAARTEQYWCPIQHSRRPRGRHPRHRRFARFGDATEFRRRQRALRRELK
jgi:hypothetical protein